GISPVSCSLLHYVRESRPIDSFSGYIELRYCTRMSNPSNGLEGLRAELAELRHRIERLEQTAGTGAAIPGATTVEARETPAKRPVTPSAPPPAPILTTPTIPPVAPPPIGRGQQIASTVLGKREPEELEGKIGQLWLNRIGIFAILIGVSYFIKY